MSLTLSGLAGPAGGGVSGSAGAASGSQALAGLFSAALDRVHRARMPSFAGSLAEQVVAVNLMYSAVNWPGGKTLSQCAVTGWQSDLL